MALSRDQIAQLWVTAGGNPKYAALMARIAKRESGGDPTAQNLTYPDHSIGLFQINQLAHKGAYGSDQALKDPLTNAKAAVALFKAARKAWGDPLKPWSTYNPAVDQKYIGEGAIAASAAQQPTSSQQAKPSVQAAPGAGQQRAALISQYLGNQHDSDALIGLATGLQSLKAVEAPVAKTGAAKARKPAAPARVAGSGKFIISGPNPNRLTAPLVNFAERVAGVYGHPLTGSDGSGHSKYTVDGNVSDHFSGNATDIPATGAKLLAMGRAALIAAGMPKAQALKAGGGLYNVNGHQVIFLTNAGGNHYDHLHISV